MKALVLAGPGGLDRLGVTDLPAPPAPGPGEAVVRIRAAALNRLDLFMVEGMPGLPPEWPHVVGTDGAGVVEAVGDGVGHVRPGDRVMIDPGLSCGTCAWCVAGEESLCDRFGVIGEHRSGTAAELVPVPARNLAAVPADMSWAAAAAFPLATLTAWRMLATRADLQPGETVLVWGAGGGVAQAAIRIGVLLGARVVVASARPEAREAALALGAEAALDHSAEDVPKAVRALTGGRGADVVVDSVGEATWPRSLRSLRRGGRMVVCGATTGPMVGLDARKLFWHGWSILGSTMGSRREFAEVVRLAHEGKLRPTVDRVVPLDGAAEAFRRLARGEQTGKVVIAVSAEGET